jgi:hypothetical protein
MDSQREPSFHGTVLPREIQFTMSPIDSIDKRRAARITDASTFLRLKICRALPLTKYLYNKSSDFLRLSQESNDIQEFPGVLRWKHALQIVCIARRTIA